MYDNNRDVVEFVEEQEPPESCSVCRFALYSEGVGLVCRKRAPVALVRKSDEYEYLDSEFPPVPSPPWCGDFEKG